MSGQVEPRPIPELVADVVCKEIRDLLAVTADEVTPHASLTELGADSLDVIEIVIALEGAFGIELPDEELEHVRTVGQLVALTQKHAAAVPRG